MHIYLNLPARCQRCPKPQLAQCPSSLAAAAVAWCVCWTLLERSPCGRGLRGAACLQSQALRRADRQLLHRCHGLPGAWRPPAPLCTYRPANRPSNRAERVRQQRAPADETHRYRSTPMRRCTTGGSSIDRAPDALLHSTQHAHIASDSHCSAPKAPSIRCIRSAGSMRARNHPKRTSTQDLRAVRPSAFFLRNSVAAVNTSSVL